MEASREATLNMYHEVIELCDNNPLIIALVAAFATSYNVFKTTVTAIVAGAVNLEAQTTGYAVAKTSSKRNLAIMASGIAGMVAAYASVNELEDLEENMNISFSKIFSSLDDEILAICTTIYNTANGLGVAVVDFGVTTVLLGAFQDAMDDYAAKKPKPKQSIQYKKAVRTQDDLLRKSADKTLKKQMDKLVVNFKTNGNALFESQYRAARVIINAGSFSTVLKILVVNAVNGLPLRNAKVYRDVSPAFKRTTIKGLSTYKDIEEGGHSFTIKHKLFNNKTVSNVMIAHGQKTTITVMMTPIGSEGTPAGDPAGFDVQEYQIPAGGAVQVLIGPINPAMQIYLLAKDGNAVVCTTNLPPNPCAGGYALNQGVPYLGGISGLSLDITKTHLQIANQTGSEIHVRVGIPQ
jgi:hypothetical protein